MTEVGSPPHILVFKNLGVNDTLLKQNYYIPARSSSHLRRIHIHTSGKRRYPVDERERNNFLSSKEMHFSIFFTSGTSVQILDKRVSKLQTSKYYMEI